VDRREKWLRRVEAVLGRNIAECLEWVEDRNVEGWVSRQLLGKGNTQTVIKRNMLFMYLNGRPVDFMRGLQKAIEELYKEWNSFNKYLVIINIKLPSNSADISSTPDKRHLFTKL
jgi:DNA mismatch repair ATPase MutL